MQRSCQMSHKGITQIVKKAGGWQQKASNIPENSKVLNYKSIYIQYDVKRQVL